MLLRGGQSVCEFCLLTGEIANHKCWKYIYIIYIIYTLGYIKSSVFETKSFHMPSQNSHVDHSNFIPGSTQIRYVELNWFKCRSFHVLNWRD